jgi:hypothetical protein
MRKKPRGVGAARDASRTLLSRWRLLLLASCAGAALAGCGGNMHSERGADTGAPTGYRVSGQIQRAGAPLAGLSVSVDDVLNWTVVTDAGGNFSIDNVTAGAHGLAVSQQNADGSFSERRNALQVAGDLTLGALQLPQPLALAPPVALPGTNKIEVSWQATDATDFREYKLYRRDSPGIDEKAGELIFVSTVRGETRFVDTALLAGKTYYYRAYVMNELGRLGGSNIVSLKVEVDNLIADGDFESETALSHWEVTSFQGGTTTLDRTMGHGGSASLHMTAFGGANLIQPITIQKDVAYDLSYFVRLVGTRNNIDDAWIGIYQGPNIVASFTIPPSAGPRLPADASGWTAQQRQTFSVVADGAITIHVINYTDDMWLDDLVLEPHARP